MTPSTAADGYDRGRAGDVLAQKEEGLSGLLSAPTVAPRKECLQAIPERPIPVYRSSGFTPTGFGFFQHGDSPVA
jgi:hypothetical protein